MQARTIAVDTSHEELVRREHLERTRAVSESLAPLFVAVFQALDRLGETARDCLSPSSPDEAYLADARSYAELRQRFHVLDQRRAQVALEVGR